MLPVNILDQYSARVEVYSIDEAFIGLRGTPAEIIATGRAIRRRVAHDLGMPVSVGIAATHTLAKLASHGAKHSPALDHVACLDSYSQAQLDAILEATPIADLWGIGSRLDRRLAGMGIRTARGLRDADPTMMRKRFNVNVARTILELRGVDCITVDDRDADRVGQIMFSRSFSTPVTSTTGMRQVMGLYAQQAATRLRRQHSTASALWVFASTSWYVEPVHRVSLAGRLPHPADDPVTIVKAACRLLLPRMEPGRRYVRAGVSLSELAPAGAQPMLDPFAPDPRRGRLGRLVDQVNAAHGRGAVGLGWAGISSPPDWQMRRDMLSNRATTHWSELATVRA